MSTYLIRSPKILGGSLVIKDTRIPASRILHLLLQGYTMELIHQDYPHVPINTLRGAIKEVADHLNRGEYA